MKKLNYHFGVKHESKGMAADFLVADCQDLFDVASQFAKKHSGELVKTAKWNELKEAYPDITLKVLDDIMFKALVD